MFGFLWISGATPEFQQAIFAGIRGCAGRGGQVFKIELTTLPYILFG
jgi:hypothetical protein